MSIEDLDEHKSTETLKKQLQALKRENVAAMRTIEKLLKDLNKKKEEIEHLKEMLTQTVPVIKEAPKVDLDISAEEEIAEVQLNKIRQAARDRTLTLEEARIYDLLVKNKRLSKDKATINLGPGQYKNVSSDQLKEIVGKVEDVESDD